MQLINKGHEMKTKLPSSLTFYFRHRSRRTVCDLSASCFTQSPTNEKVGEFVLAFWVSYNYNSEMTEQNRKNKIKWT